MYRASVPVRVKLIKLRKTGVVWYLIVLFYSIACCKNYCSGAGVVICWEMVFIDAPGGVQRA
jgi:hypothetical protein